MKEKSIGDNHPDVNNHWESTKSNSKLIATSEDNSISIIKNLTFVTNPLKRIFKKIRLPLYLNESGCWFQAGSGQGKSTATEYCRKALLAEIPSLPIFTLNEHVLPASALRAFFIRMLILSGHLTTTGETARLRLRLAKQLAILADACPLRLVVLLLDEGQAFRDIDLFILKDLSNDMEHLGYGLLTFIFGEAPTMGDRVSALLEGKNPGIAERFVGGHQLKFETYTSEEDWLSLFSAIDRETFDIFNGKTVAQFYFKPSDVSNFRFSAETARFYEALEKIKKDGFDLNLRRIFTAIRWVILNTKKSLPSKLESLPVEIWDEAFNYISTLRDV